MPDWLTGLTQTIDFPKLSELVLSFISGVAVTYIAHQLAQRRHVARQKSNLLIMCDAAVSPIWHEIPPQEIENRMLFLTEPIPPPDDLLNLIYIQVVNAGERQVTIDYISLEFTNGMGVLPTVHMEGADRFPATIQPTERLTVWLSFDAIVKHLRSCGPGVTVKGALVSETMGEEHRAPLREGLLRSIEAELSSPSPPKPADAPGHTERDRSI